MPVYTLQGPDGKTYQVEGPAGATAEQLGAFISGQTAPKQYYSQQLFNNPPQEEASMLERVRGAVASGPISLYLGAKQAVSELSPEEKNVLQQNKEAAQKGGVISALSNAATMAPVALVPGANTLVGAGLAGGGFGALQPVEEGESRGKNALIGATLGTVGQGVGQYGGQYLKNRANAAISKQQELAGQNATRDATLAKGQEAGYALPPSEVNPSFLTNRLESIGGKAAIGQEAAARNQQVTNSLARKALGLDADKDLNMTALENLRRTAGKAYEDIASLSPQAKADLEALKQARNDATGWFKAYNRSASPDDLRKAKEFRAQADQLEQSLEAAAKRAGKEDLIPALADARQRIAKSYTVERALNQGSGDVSAPVLGRMLGKGAPLSGDLETIAKFQQAFPNYMREGAKAPAAGVSKSEALASAVLGLAGAGVTGNPIGAAAALLPMMSGPARALALSKALRPVPDYGTGMLTNAASNLNPELAAKLLKAGIPAYALSHE